jgi:hypothetical protein
VLAAANVSGRLPVELALMSGRTLQISIQELVIVREPTSLSQVDTKQSQFVLVTSLILKEDNTSTMQLEVEPCVGIDREMENCGLRTSYYYVAFCFVIFLECR